MAQHFLLSAKARNISLRKVFQLSDDAARELMARLRWGSVDRQACPHCGALDNHRFVRLQKRWRCRHCYKAFSVTSGTVFSHHKLPLQTLLGAIVLYANAVKGLSALQMARDLHVQYKTAYVLLHKLRESLWLTKDTDLLTGEVEIDGGYMHTYVRPKNRKSERPDLRLAEHQNPNKCVILVLRQRSPERRRGAVKTRIFVLPSENATDIRAVVAANVAPGAHLITDEAPGFTTLGAKWEHSVVTHAEEYQTEEGVNENQAESFIARFRRLLMGQIHKLQRKYLDVYAHEIAFREDNRRQPNGDNFRTILGKCLALAPSRNWSKYWQGNKRLTDSVVSYA